MDFRIVSRNRPAGDQETAIESLISGINDKKKYQVLLGITGSGKTFTMANVIERLNRPTLILSHNKTLAAQLYGELKTLFPHNAVEYFISYYDYYQPEAYLPARDIYIEKEATINEQIEKMRLRATASLLSRNDVVVVSSVSSIYTLGNPDEFSLGIFSIEKGGVIPFDSFIEKLISMQYLRNDTELKRGTFRVRGDTVDLFPTYADNPYRVVFFDEEIESIDELDVLNNLSLNSIDSLSLFPVTHFMVSRDKVNNAIISIKKELKERLGELHSEKKFLEAERLNSRTNYDLEMLEQTGFCSGIENYSRHMDGRQPGQRPYTLMDFFPDGFLTVIDESHVTIPQIRGMHNGDRARKMNLVDYGFRLKSALDNRPLRLEEFENVAGSIICMSATPSDYEREKAGVMTEMIIRPTGLVDPEIEIRSSTGQVDDLMKEIQPVIERNERVLVTTLTKRMAESLTEYLEERNVKVRYMHSDIDAIERVDIIRGLRLGEFDVLVGINLLREGLDLPEVSLVAILDADREGFLRSETSLIQTIGRASRNVKGKVILYADKMTGSIEKAFKVTVDRRQKQLQYNMEHGIEPATIIRSTDDIMLLTELASRKKEKTVIPDSGELSNIEILELTDKLNAKMHEHAAELEFEEAANIRDMIRELRKKIKTD